MKLRNALLRAVAAAGIAGMAVAPLPAVASITVAPPGVNPVFNGLPAPAVGFVPPAGTGSTVDNFLSQGFGIPGTTPGTPQGYGVYGGQLQGHAGMYQIDIYGAEASFTNNFEWSSDGGATWTTLFTHTGGNTILPGQPPGIGLAPVTPVPLTGQTFFVTQQADGTLNFRFSIEPPGAPITFITNGSNPDDPRRLDPNQPNIANFVFFTDPTSSTQPNSSPFWYVGLDDGNPVDDDHDDLNIRITKIPTPGAILLFGVGLVGLGLTRRRRAIAA